MVLTDRQTSRLEGFSDAAFAIGFGAPGYFYGLLGLACYLHAVGSERRKPALRSGSLGETDGRA